MYEGGVAISERSLNYDVFCQYVSEHLHTIERLPLILVTVPLSLDRTYWVEDPDLDSNMHCAALPHPGGWKEFGYLVSRLFS
jgi:diacylglycerol O-acyltransferase